MKQRHLCLASLLLLNTIGVYALAASGQHGHHSSDSNTAPHDNHTPDKQPVSKHVPPAPPTRTMPAMSYEDMVTQMQMDDTSRLGMVSIEKIEWRNDAAADSVAWDAQAWYGSDYYKLWFKSEGERPQSDAAAARVEALWDRAFSRWWNLQVGARVDLSEGPTRSWAAIGVQGLAPYWFETEATLYIGDAGRAAMHFKSSYELLLTQRLIIQPEAEINLYLKNDAINGIGAGISDLEIGIRLRYEFRREFAPYVGWTWSQRVGNSADYARAAGDSPKETQWVAGIRLWF